ncbi:MAG TPA: sulfatase [Solirubrobacterales bacterium]|nr:sulfatase [Solirubrobacterales bacterium]
MLFRSHHRIALGGATLFAAACLGLAASSPLPGAPSGADGAPGAGRPNIILIQTDDQTYKQLTRRAMPNTKRLLAQQGTRFTDYIATTAQCCPSRASLLTGQYAHNHGVTSNTVAYPGLVDRGNVLPVWLHRAGYWTIHVGKFLNGYERAAQPDSVVAPGWDQWHTVLGNTAYYGYDLFVNGSVRHYGRHRGDHITHVLNRRAVRMVRRYAPKGHPFYLQLDQRAPHVGQEHDPYGRCGRAPIPLPSDRHRFQGVSLPKTPSFNEANMRDKPNYLSSAPKVGFVERRKIRKHWRCALASLRGVDRGVAKVYDAVKHAGDLRKTVFIFTSDNGQFYGQHRLRTGKVLPFEEALNLPLLIRVPKRYRGGASRVKKVGRPVGNIDLAPTILDLAHAQPCSAPDHCRTMDGRSLMPLLTRSGRWPRNRALLTEYRTSDAGRYATCEFAGIRTRDDIYVQHSRVVDPSTSQCVPDDERERYDLKKDPFELRNLCFGGSSDNCPVTAKQVHLEQRLSQLRRCAGIAGRNQHVGGRPFCE